ncbi:MAG: hypothetical protein V4850_16620 [Myxococcota bacterium]
MLTLALVSFLSSAQAQDIPDLPTIDDVFGDWSGEPDECDDYRTAIAHYKEQANELTGKGSRFVWRGYYDAMCKTAKEAIMAHCNIDRDVIESCFGG